MSRPTARQLAPVACTTEERIDLRAEGLPLLHIIGLSGTGSNAGKTTLAEQIVGLLAQRGVRVAALKVTRAHDGECPVGDTSCLVCSTAGSSFRIVSEARVLAMKGKDTGRYVAAGAAQVRWLITNPASVAAGVRAVAQHFREPCVLVAEGNSFCDYAAVDQLVLVCGAQPPKPSVAALLPRVTALVAGLTAPGTGEAPATSPELASTLSASMDLPCDAPVLEEPAAEALVARIPAAILARCSVGQ